jgi:hypothetical protein
MLLKIITLKRRNCQMSKKWRLTGSYFEACNCDAACPCVFLSPPTLGECTALIGWHVEKGNYEDTGLDGLNVALAVHAPGPMLTTKWKAALYFDDKASEDQKNALMKIFTGQEGGHPAVLVSFVGEVLGAKSVGIKYNANGKKRSLKIEGVVEAEIEAISGADGGNVTLHDLPLAVSPGYPTTVARSKTLNYHDYGLQWEISERNGFFSPFTYQAD